MSAEKVTKAEVPIKALNAEELPANAFEKTESKIRSILESEAANVMASLKTELLALSDYTVGQLSVFDLTGSSYQSDLPPFFSNGMQVDFSGMAPTGLSLIQKVNGVKMRHQLPIAVYSTLIMNVHALVTFLCPRNVESVVTSVSLSRALAAVALKLCFGAGSLSIMKHLGYIVRLRSMEVMVVGQVTSSGDTTGFLPEPITRPSRRSLRSALECFCIQQGEGAAKRTVRVVPIGVFANRCAYEPFNELFGLQRALAACAASQSYSRQRRFMYQLVLDAIAPLFEDTPPLMENYFAAAGGTASSTFSFHALREFDGTGDDSPQELITNRVKSARPTLHIVFGEDGEPLIEGSATMPAIAEGSHRDEKKARKSNKGE